MSLVLCLCLFVLLDSHFIIATNELSNSSSVEFQFPKDRKATPTGRVIGGVEVTPHSYPFIAGLIMYYANSMTFCGGTLISPKWVMTAAHCVYDNPSQIEVILGANDVKISEPTQVRLKTSSYIVHENWNMTSLQNDIALVELPNNVAMNEYITTVVYQKANQNYEGLNGTVVGWGLTEYINDIADDLRKVDSVILTNEQCKTIYPYDQIIIPTHMCLDGSGPVGACNGDSGGPLLVGNLQVGIVSFLYDSCTAGKPSVFTRVVEFEDWIEKHAFGGGENIIVNNMNMLLTLFLFIICRY